MDAGVTAQLKDIDYPDSPYGRQKQSQKSVNLDLNYQPSEERVIYGFYTYQNNRTNQKSIGSTGTCLLGTTYALGTVTAANAADICAAPGGPIFPLANEWFLANTDRNHVLGLGLMQDFGKARLNLNFTRSLGRSEVHYTYTPGGAITVANAPFAGSGMPDITVIQNIFDASLVVPVSRQIAVRMLYRYESGSIRDWHYQGLDASPIAAATVTTLPTAVVLDGGPLDYRVNVIGIMLQIKM